MAIVFAPPYKDPNAEFKQMLLQYAGMLGGQRRETKQQQQAQDFARSLDPTQIPTANGQPIFSPQGAANIEAGWLGGQPTRTGMMQGARLNPLQIMQKALQSGLPMNEAIGAARLAPTPKPTKRQLLRSEGYSPEEVRRIRDIQNGLEPRKSNRKTYDNMTIPEKLKYLSTEKQRAEGQYFGVEGGNLEARQPKYLAWIKKELAKLEEPTAKKDRPVKPAEYPDAEWSEEHKMWTVIRDGRLKGIK